MTGRLNDPVTSGSPARSPGQSANTELLLQVQDGCDCLHGDGHRARERDNPPIHTESHTFWTHNEVVYRIGRVVITA